MRDFRDIQAWHKAHALTLAVYRATELLPREEKYGLVSQMRRSAASVPTNIAEGCGRNSEAELARFMEISMGSACELEYQLLLSYELGYLLQADYQKLNLATIEVKKMLAPFIRRLRS